jgi:leucyl/phenylalanyl-tRNA--protein transferase
VAIGGLFAGESMFHHETDASKAALVGLVAHLDDHPDTLVDCQWLTPHLESMGAEAIERAHYVALLERALQRPLPARLLEAADRS